MRFHLICMAGILAFAGRAELLRAADPSPVRPNILWLIA